VFPLELARHRAAAVLCGYSGTGQDGAAANHRGEGD
jgi:hypothetical protein